MNEFVFEQKLRLLLRYTMSKKINETKKNDRILDNQEETTVQSRQTGSWHIRAETRR